MHLVISALFLFERARDRPRVLPLIPDVTSAQASKAVPSHGHSDNHNKHLIIRLVSCSRLFAIVVAPPIQIHAIAGAARQCAFTLRPRVPRTGT